MTVMAYSISDISTMIYPFAEIKVLAEQLFKDVSVMTYPISDITTSRYNILAEQLL